MARGITATGDGGGRGLVDPGTRALRRATVCNAAPRTRVTNAPPPVFVLFPLVDDTSLFRWPRRLRRPRYTGRDDSVVCVCAGQTENRRRRTKSRIRCERELYDYLFLSASMFLDMEGGAFDGAAVVARCEIRIY